MKSDRSREVKKGGLLGSRLFDCRLLAAIWAGKLLILFARLLGRGGTTLPGRAAMKIKPRLSAMLASDLRRGALVVTGTNGKTTTSALISAILQESGFTVVHNQAGSNLSWGAATALLEAASLRGRLDVDYAVIETDEGAFPGMVEALSPLGAVATNIFRDQLDRYGEVDYISASIRRGLEAQTKDSFQVINADEPSLVSISDLKRARLWTYGLEAKLAPGPAQNTGRDLKRCPDCGSALAYSQVNYAHLGRYSCPDCSFKRPIPLVSLNGSTENSDGSISIEIATPGGPFKARSRLPGTYNLYNILAAVTCAIALGVDSSTIASALQKAAPSFGRMEQFESKGKKIVMALIKNPVGTNEVLNTLITRPGKLNMLVAINDKIADGRDVSWLWDVDFEQLAACPEKVSLLIASGLRAWDMAVRFKYAGFDKNMIKVCSSFAEAIKTALANTDVGETLYILPSYTAMLELRKELNRMGMGKPYWES